MPSDWKHQLQASQILFTTFPATVVATEENLVVRVLLVQLKSPVEYSMQQQQQQPQPQPKAAITAKTYREVGCTA